MRVLLLAVSAWVFSSFALVSLWSALVYYVSRRRRGDSAFVAAQLQTLEVERDRRLRP
jgi:hypothetical protein